MHVVHQLQVPDFEYAKAECAAFHRLAEQWGSASVLMMFDKLLPLATPDVRAVYRHSVDNGPPVNAWCGVVGGAMGILAGYLRGWVDLLISRLIDIWMAFPPVLFSILLIAVLGPGLSSIIIAIVVIDWTRFARVVRAEAMGQGAMDYVASARVAGRGRIGIMLREVLPNVLPTIGVLLTLEMGIAVIVEAILSFVNLSISTDAPTWGGMIAEGRATIHHAWWVLVFPLVTLFLTILSLSQLGEGLKDRFDPVLR